MIISRLGIDPDNRIGDNKIDFNESRVSFKDYLAMLIACFQIIIPYMLISLAVFGFLTWFLVRFWVN